MTGADQLTLGAVVGVAQIVLDAAQTATWWTGGAEAATARVAHKREARGRARRNRAQAQVLDASGQVVYAVAPDEEGIVRVLVDRTPHVSRGHWLERPRVAGRTWR